MRASRKRLGTGLAVVFAAGASAAPLRLDYCVQSAGGGLYRYTFTLVLDNSDQSWVAGQGFGWIVFGDEPGPPQGAGVTPLAGFAGDAGGLPAGPFTLFETEAGAHNGPALGPVVLPQPPAYPVNLWTPGRVGDSITWRGTSTADLAQGQLRWSVLATSGGGLPLAWAVATRIQCGPPIGACCRPDGSCALLAQTTCALAGGLYRGDDTGCDTANCSPGGTGACCLPSLTCSVLSFTACAAQEGVYRGDGVTCAAAECPAPWAEQGDAGDLPSTAQVILGTGPLAGISGTLESGGSDLYRFRICDAIGWGARTVAGASFDTQLFLFDAAGLGMAANDDDPLGLGGVQSRLTGALVSGVGEYYLGLSAADRDPLGAPSGLELWLDLPYATERPPDGPGASEPIGSWGGAPGAGGAYVIILTGSCRISPCVPDCNGDHALNVNDFVCFQQQFAAADPAADCDRSGGLNVNDFVCFQQAFAAGCSSL